MLTLTLVIGSLLTLSQSPSGAAAPTPACTVLSAQEISSLIGPTKTLPVMGGSRGSTCMFQNGDKMVTVMVVNLDSIDSAKGQWQAKKAATAGQDVAGWNVPAYASVFEKPNQHSATVGFVKAKSFVEASVIDLTQGGSAMSTKLQAVMKTLAGRM